MTECKGKMMTDKLKPCPFCGGDAVISRDVGAVGPFSEVECTVCFVLMSNGENDKEAIEMWNKRQ